MPQGYHKECQSPLQAWQRRIFHTDKDKEMIVLPIVVASKYRSQHGKGTLMITPALAESRDSRAFTFGLKFQTASNDPRAELLFMGLCAREGRGVNKFCGYLRLSFWEAGTCPGTHGAGKGEGEAPNAWSSGLKEIHLFPVRSCTTNA